LSVRAAISKRRIDPALQRIGVWAAAGGRRIGSALNRSSSRVTSGGWQIPFLSGSLNSIAVICGLLVVLSAASLQLLGRVYPLEATLKPRAERQLVLIDDNGKKFARRGGCVDAPVSVEELPQHLIDALLAMEDRRFYYHFGIDPQGILRAAFNNYQADRIVEGGSTITQQLAKVTYLTSEKTFERKLKEALIVLRLEMLLSKDQILERYLSAAYFGEGCHGLRAAARHYFRKSASDLTLSESALLVAFLRAPSRLAKHRDEARDRQKLVLKSMVETGALDEARLKTLEPGKIVDNSSTLGAYYADWIAQTVDASHGDAGKPLKVRTSFDPVLQSLADEAVEKVLKANAKRLRVGQAALVAMRPDGRVLAMVGGRDYRKSQFNRAYQALRQPGSSFKTFVYLAALRAGANPDMYASDEPITIGDWSPQNYGRNYRGPVSLRTAFAFSINTVAVRVSEAIGRDDVITASRDLGITSPLASTPSIALGTSEVSLLELTSAYAAVAADAYPVLPWGVEGFGEGEGKGRPPGGAGQWRLMVGDQMRDLLATTVDHGTAQGARLPVRAYGKTGTSQDFRDAWFIGFAGNLVVGVWVGNDDNKPMRRVTGGSLPAQIWRQFMTGAIRKDKHFHSRLQRVAAYPARIRRDRLDYRVAQNDFLVEPRGLFDFFEFLSPRAARRFSEYGRNQDPRWSQREWPEPRRGWSTQRRRSRSWWNY